MGSPGRGWERPEAAWLAEVHPVRPGLGLLLNAASKLGLISIQADQPSRTTCSLKNLKRTQSLQADLLTTDGIQRRPSCWAMAPSARSPSLPARPVKAALALREPEWKKLGIARMNSR